MSLVATLEALSAVSMQNQGISTSTQKLHYIWTYGPTAVFSVLAIFWSKVEYYTKVLPPWKLMSIKPQPAKYSLLLDYISPNQVFALWNSLCAKDYTVSVSILGSLLVIAATVVSTGLFVLQPLSVIRLGAMIDYHDEFSFSHFNSSLVDSVPLLLAVGLLSNLSIAAPPGTNQTYAVRSFNASEPLYGTLNS